MQHNIKKLKQLDVMHQVMNSSPDEDCEIQDPLTPNLFVVFWGGEAAQFVCRVQRGERELETVLGTCSDLTLDDARAWVRDWATPTLSFAASPESDPQRECTLTVSTFFKEYYLSYSVLHHKSAEGNLSLFKRHIEPKFGHILMADVSKSDIRAWTQQLKAKGYSNAMVNRVLVLFGHLYTIAEEYSLSGVPNRKSLGIKLLSDPHKRTVSLTREQIRCLQGEIEKSSNIHLRYIVPFLLFTGARKREALDARWSDINLHERQWVVPDTKSGKPRIIYLSEKCVDLLTDLATSKNRDIMHREFLFPNPKTGIPYRCIFHSWSIAREAAGLPELRIHDLRHTYASKLVNNGVPLYDVQALLGHSSIKTTQRYAHLSRDRLLQSTNLFKI